MEPLRVMEKEVLMVMEKEPLRVMEKEAQTVLQKGFLSEEGKKEKQLEKAP